MPKHEGEIDYVVGRSELKVPHIASLRKRIGGLTTEYTVLDFFDKLWKLNDPKGRSSSKDNLADLVIPSDAQNPVTVIRTALTRPAPPKEEGLEIPFTMKAAKQPGDRRHVIKQRQYDILTAPEKLGSWTENTTVRHTSWSGSDIPGMRDILHPEFVIVHKGASLYGHGERLDLEDLPPDLPREERWKIIDEKRHLRFNELLHDTVELLGVPTEGTVKLPHPSS